MSNTLVNLDGQGNLSSSSYSESDIRELLSNFAAYKKGTDEVIAALKVDIKDLTDAISTFVTYGSVIKIQNGYQGFGTNKHLNAHSNFIAREGTVGAGNRYDEFKFKILKYSVD